MAWLDLGRSSLYISQVPARLFSRQTLKKAGEKQIASQTPEPWASGV